GEVALVGDDGVGQAAPADDPEDAVALAPGRDGGAAGDDAARDLEPGDVLRRPGRSRVVPGPLGQVGGVQPRVRGADEDLVVAWYRIGALPDGHDLGAAGARVG